MWPETRFLILEFWTQISTWGYFISQEAIDYLFLALPLWAVIILELEFPGETQEMVEAEMVIIVGRTVFSKPIIRVHWKYWWYAEKITLVSIKK